MVNLRTFFLLVLLLSVGFLNASGQDFILQQSNESGIYEKGENIEVSVNMKNLATNSLSFRILKNNSDEIKNESIRNSGELTTVYSGSFDEPTSLIFEISADEQVASIGLVVDPYNFEPGSPRPKDFNSYWRKEKKALRALSMDISDLPESDIEEGYTCSGIEINCTGPKPARGYYAKPLDAKKKSLPIVLLVHAAGVKGHWCLSQPENALRYAKMGKGALCFDLNAHGMLIGQPQEYYDKLEEGELNGYYRQGLESRNDFYFRGMYLRLIRTLDFLTAQAEWDGKRILVIGESQGGGQAFAAAGLDKRVSAAVATVPAMCDWGGGFVGRKAGWPAPFNNDKDKEKMKDTLPYFDASHLLKNSRAILVSEIGFIDMTCPSSSIYAAINQSKGEKIIYTAPYRGHHLNQKEYQNSWEETVYQPKMDFIKNYLE